MINFAPTTSKFFILPSKNPEKFPDLIPVIRIKNDPVKVDLFVETSKLIRIGSRDSACHYVDGIPPKIPRAAYKVGGILCTVQQLREA